MRAAIGGRALRAAAGSGAVALMLIASIGLARAEPVHPVDPQQILLRVPPGASAVRATAGNPRASTGSLVEALQLAQTLIAEGRRTSQPSGFGRAEALLDRWRGAAQSSAQWHILAADIHQYRHQYGQALSLLDRAIDIDQRAVRAHLMRGAILQTQGDFIAARAACGSVLALGERMLGSACLAQIEGMTGRLDRAYELLGRLAQDERTRDGNPSVRVWLLESLADMADRRGDLPTAQLHLREAIALDPGGVLPRLSLADTLLAAGQADEAEALLRGLPVSQAVLVRRAAATRALGGDPAPVLVEAHQALAAARERGEQMELRDAVRLSLLAGRPCEAVRTGQQNWERQRESTDIRLLLAALRECYDARPATEIERWLVMTGYQDVRAGVAQVRNARANAIAGRTRSF